MSEKETEAVTEIEPASEPIPEINPENNEAQLDKQNFEELRSAIRHFDRIIRAQMAIQDTQGNRIKNSIRAGMLFLVLIGISIFVILMAMVTQVEQIASAVDRMDSSFGEVRSQMIKVDKLMTGMEGNVATMQSIDTVMQGMDAEMVKMAAQIEGMRSEVDSMSAEVRVMRQQADLMTHTAGVMDMEIYRLNRDVNRMATPARTLNHFFPIP